MSGRAVTVGDLQARVAAESDRLDLPSWPNPHPDAASPREDEYSRLTDPERYRIVHERARIWAAVLEDTLGARAETLPAEPDAVLGPGPHERRFDRAVRMVPQQAGGLPLVLHTYEVSQPGQASLAVLEIAVVRADIVLERQPDCGCDACDSGSEDLLEAIDAVIRQVVGGPYVVLRGQGWHAHWHPDGASAGGKRSRAEFDEVMELCRRLADGESVRLPRRTTAYVGRPWTG